ncbi:hypothetical protein D3C76_1234370 [compost metagenome]
MKVSYPFKGTAEIKEIKESLKPYGGRCAKIVDGNLEFQIQEDNQNAAYEALKNKGMID